MRSTLVTGGAGFIGSNLVSALLARGDRVTVLDDLSSGHRANLEPYRAVRFVDRDICDPVAVAEAMEGAEVVFHLAASVGNARSLADPLRDAEVNVLGTLRILEAARARGVRKIVVSSSAAIFGELKTLPIRESHPVEPDTPYGASKLGAEKECLAYARLYDMDIVCLRYFNVYGPNQRYDAYGNVIPIFVFKALQGGPLTIFGDGEQTRDFVNVRDVVQANLKAAEVPGCSGAYNIASGTSVTINQLATNLAAVDGLKPVVQYGAPRPGDVRDSLADVTAAERAFGYKPTTGLGEGLREYVAWARSVVPSGSLAAG